MPDLIPSQVITNAEAYAASTDDPMFKDLIPDAATQAFFDNTTSTAGSILNLLQTLGAAAMRENARVPNQNLLQTYPAPSINYDGPNNQFNYGATLRFESAKLEGPIYSLSDDIPNTVADWFIDSINGNDSNSGKTSQSAIQTYNQLVESGVRPGEKILFRYGSVFSEFFDFRNLSNLELDAYGDPADGLPLFRADDDINSGWALAGGTANWA
ncbi:MAG: hypothetical protein AAF282_05470 [Cyanobacteria bacterium P01_A01_bin.15]